MSGSTARPIGCFALALGVLVLGCSDAPDADAPDARPDDCPSDLPSSARCASGTPSYGLEVAPIVERRCSVCHFPGNAQSRDVFVEQADIYEQRQTVLTRVYSCVMPPADGAPLTAEERSTLLAWLVCGAPDN